MYRFYEQIDILYVIIKIFRLFSMCIIHYHMIRKNKFVPKNRNTGSYVGRIVEPIQEPKKKLDFDKITNKN